MAGSGESWEKFLNPVVLKQNLIRISLFIAAFETFKTQTLSKPESFFTNGFNEDGFIVDEQHSTKVLPLAKSRLLASLLWLQSLGAVDDSDIQKFNSIREYRNALAHEPMKVLMANAVDFDESKFQDLISLLVKIEQWWVVNFEMAIDPESYPADLDPEQVVAGSVFQLQMMLDIALGNEPADGHYYKLYKEFKKWN